jgi:hypothetical protein
MNVVQDHGVNSSSRKFRYFKELFRANHFNLHIVGIKLAIKVVEGPVTARGCRPCQVSEYSQKCVRVVD